MSLIAKDWPEYSSQGAPFAAIESWWKNNWFRVSADSGSFNDWREWYMNHFYGDWSKNHKGPEETLRIMQAESQQPQTSSPPLSSSQTSLPASNSPIRTAMGVDIEHTSDGIKRFMQTLVGVCSSLGIERPVVTSGFRSAKSQARAMAANWLAHGGSMKLSKKQLQDLGSLYTTILTANNNREITRGLLYLYNLYGNKEMAVVVNSIFEEHGPYTEGCRIVSEYLDSEEHVSSHMENPATAIDLKNTKGIEEALRTIKNSGQFNMQLLNEGNHYHVDIQ